MAKRSREDFEPSLSPDSSSPPEDSSVRIIKIQQLSPSGEDDQNTTTSSEPAMRCSLPPHRQTLSFPSFEDYEVHYAKEHTHRCLECRKNFPTGHFLSLHIEENHDSLVAVRRERGEKTYACFVTDCDRICSTPQKRRLHLIDKHTFPKDYDFFVVNNGIDRRSSMLRSGRHRRGSSAAVVTAEKEKENARRRASTLEGSTDSVEKDEDGMNVDEEEEEDEVVEREVEKKVLVRKEVSDQMMEDLVGGISALKFVPPSVRFGRGRGKGRGGFSRS